MNQADQAIVIRVAENYAKGRRTSLREARHASGIMASNGAMSGHLGFTPYWTGNYRSSSLSADGWLRQVSAGTVGRPGPRIGCLTLGPKFGGLLKNRKTGAVTLLAKIE